MDLSIVIVTWNARQLLCNCLDSLYASATSFRYEVIVVDNASDDDTRETLGRRYPQVRLVANAENVGFSRANNQGFEAALGRYILVLNPDTVLPSQETLEALVRGLIDNPEAGGIGCRLVFPDGRRQVGDAGYRPTVTTSVVHAFALSRLSPRLFQGLFLTAVERFERTPVDVDWISGACFLVRREVIDRVGGFDEHIFMYAEDIEWGCRIRCAGFRILYLPNIVVIHVQGGTQLQAGRRVISTRWLDSLWRLYQATNPRSTWWIFKAAFALGMTARGALYYGHHLTTGSPNTGHKARAMFAYARRARFLTPEVRATP